MLFFSIMLPQKLDKTVEWSWGLVFAPVFYMPFRDFVQARTSLSSTGAIALNPSLYMTGYDASGRQAWNGRGNMACSLLFFVDGFEVPCAFSFLREGHLFSSLNLYASTDPKPVHRHLDHLISRGGLYSVQSLFTSVFLSFPLVSTLAGHTAQLLLSLV